MCLLCVLTAFRVIKVQVKASPTKRSQMTRSISWGRFEGVPMVSMNRSRPFNPASRIRFLRATLMASAPSRGLPADPRMLSGTDVLPAHALPAQALPAFNLKLKSSSR